MTGHNLPPCIHRDNWDFCRIKQAPWYIRFIMPEGRMKCIFESRIILQDGEETCDDRVMPDRPVFPTPFTKKT